MLGACGSAQPTAETKRLQEPGVVKPKNDTEQQVLQAAALLKTGQSDKNGTITVTVVKSYFAASGRQCKSIQVSEGALQSIRDRIICQFDNDWGFAPDVLNAPEQ